MIHPRIRAALRAAGVHRLDSSRIEHIARGTFRVHDGARMLACKLFDGPQAGERARTEGAAYASLAARGAPVPRLLAVDQSNPAIVREWVEGPTLAQALRGESARPAWGEVSTAWNTLLAALDAWTDALDPARVERAQSLRTAEIAAVAESVIDSEVVRIGDPAWAAAAEEIRRLANLISGAPVRTVPLDLNPGNLVVDSYGIVFVDLEAFGLDFADWSLCKATMLPHDPTSGRAGQALVAGQENASRPLAESPLLAGALLLALADAAGLWRSEPPHPAGLTLVRELSTRTTNGPHLAAALV